MGHTGAALAVKGLAGDEALPDRSQGWDGGRCRRRYGGFLAGLPGLVCGHEGVVSVSWAHGAPPSVSGLLVPAAGMLSALKPLMHLVHMLLWWRCAGGLHHHQAHGSLAHTTALGRGLDEGEAGLTGSV